MTNNNNNNKKEKSLINTLIHYFTRNQIKHRTTTSVRINPEVKEEFYYTCRKMGILSKGHFNIALEALMNSFSEEYKDSPAVVQTTLVSSSRHSREDLNVAKKLEVRMISRQLKSLLEGLQQGRGHKDFMMGRLGEVLAKAIRLYEETRDKDIADLLNQAEKWV